MIPAVSVIMPVYNGAEYLEQALQSVLQQNVKDIQFIVVDDGSNDGSAEVLARHGQTLSVITQSNQGPPVARNAGLQKALGHYVAFIDADDLWMAGRLQRQLHYLDSHPATDIVQERIQHIAFDGKVWIHQEETFHAMSLSAALYRRSVFDRVGLLDSTMTYCDDVDWFLRAQREHIAIDREDQVGLLYRRHDKNLTRNKNLVERYTLRALLKHRRAGVTLPR